jgi:hypothetical protein
MADLLKEFEEMVEYLVGAYVAQRRGNPTNNTSLSFGY